MKALVAVGALVVTVASAIVVLALLNLHALIGAHRDRLLARVTSVIGRPVDVGGIDPSWWPLGIRLRDVVIAEDPAFGNQPLLRADGLTLGVHAWPLVRGRIEAGGVTLDRPRMSIIRDAAGRWNVESLGEAASDDGGNRSKPKESRRGLLVPVEWVAGVALADVREGTVTIEDRRGAMPARVVVEHVRVRAEDIRFGANARIRVRGVPFGAEVSDAELDLRIAGLGQNDVEHTPFTARLAIDGADLATVAAWLGRAEVASGRLGTLSVDAEGTLERARLRIGLTAVDPALRIGALLGERLEPLAVDTTLVHAHDSVTIEDLRTTVGTHALSAHGEATFGPDGVALIPLAIEVDNLPLELRGWITGLAPPALDVHLTSRPFGGSVTADLTLDGSGAARMHVEAGAIDVAAAVTHFAPELVGAVEGHASGAAVLSAHVTGGAFVAGSLTGDGSLAVSGGRLIDVNLPDRVIDQIEHLPLMPTLVSASTRARYAELFASRDTVIESAEVPFTIIRGRFATERAVLSNPAYQIAGDGWIDDAGTLRFHGTVLLGASVSRTLREDVHAAKILAVDDGRVALPFVARGPLASVRVEPDVKRLRARGLEALLGQPEDAAAPGERDHGHGNRGHTDDLEHHVIERLEKMLRP